MTARVIPLPLPPGAGAALARLDDAALLAVCATGHRAAVAVLFDRFSADVARFVSRLLGSGHPDLDDVVQATFIGAVQAAARFEQGASVRTWLLAIATRQAFTQLRSSRRRDQALARLAQVPSAGGGPSPESRAADRELMGQVERALQALSPEHRAAFLLCEVEGAPGPEAARLLDVNPGTLRRRLCEARARLRALLGVGPSGGSGAGSGPGGTVR